jgi:hypothetical protein
MTADDYSEEQMQRATALLRAQQNAEARKRDGIASAIDPRNSDMTVGDAFDEIQSTLESDGFWADLGSHVIAGRQGMKDGTAEGRRSARDALVQLRDQIVELHHYFKVEQQVIETIIELLNQDDRQTTVDLDTTLSGLRTTRSDEDRAAAAQMDEKSSQLKRLADPVMKQFGATTLSGAEPVAPEAKDPWLFTEVKNEPSCTVVVVVPEATKARDCEVCIQASSIKIVVKGHERQPVVDGDLAGAVDPEACGWSIEGSGADRRLVIELEKKMGGFQWDQLLKLK